MKAALRDNYCEPKDILISEVKKPIVNSDEVLVRVKATTVNRTDCANLTAKPFIMRFILGLFKPKKPILGTDFAGIVESVGSEVQDFKIDQRVFGFNDMGYQSQAEYIKLPMNGHIISVPPNISYQQAAAGVEGAHYAYSFVKKSNIQRGNSILINGATGAIGSALLQLCKQFDVTITATANTKNVKLIKSIGADKVIDYTKEDFTKTSEKFDFVFDAVGKSTFGKCKGILKEKGTYISSELGPYSQNIFLALSTPLFSRKKVIFPKPYAIKTTLPYIQKLLGNETLSPIIDKEYSMDEIIKAYEYVISGRKTGNVIINIDN